MYSPRALVNRSGVTFDATKLSTPFAEDWDEIKTAFEALEKPISDTFSSYLSTTWSPGTTTSYTLVPFDSTDIDPGSNFDTSLSKYVVPSNGFYFIHSRLELQGFTFGAQTLEMAIAVNGTVVKECLIINDIVGVILQLTELLTLSLGDEVTILFRCVSGASVDTVGGITKSTFVGYPIAQL